MLKKDQEDLTITAKGDWVVATVDVRDGEKVSSFNPIITLTRKSPTIIRGYINEKVYTALWWVRWWKFLHKRMDRKSAVKLSV
jgi:HlyD family secretion protein